MDEGFAAAKPFPRQICFVGIVFATVGVSNSSFSHGSFSGTIFALITSVKI